jgi:uncharacterized membrane protein YphA (DoxX/SURF4 family)
MVMSKLQTLLLAVVFSPSIAMAHERWIQHELSKPVNDALFTTMSTDMASVVGRTVFIFLVFMTGWIYRDRIERVVRKTLKRQLHDKPLAVALEMSDFVFGREMHGALFARASNLAMRFVTTVPALVLMFAAARGDIIMPSFPIPLSSPHLGLLRFGQAALAVLIITDVAIAYVGASLCGLVAYCLGRYGAIVAVDALPVLGVAFIYLTQNSKVFSAGERVKWCRAIVGISFFLLGVMKMANHNLTVGVADQWPDVLQDPMIRLFWYGTDAQFQREWWCIGFGMSEMMTGLVLAFGFFSRPLALLVAAEFTSLMVFHFGWPEFPHFYPIAVLLVVVFSQGVKEDLKHPHKQFLSAKLAGLAALAALMLTSAVGVGATLRAKEENCVSQFEGRKIISRVCLLDKGHVCEVELNDGSRHLVAHDYAGDVFRCSSEAPN